MTIVATMADRITVERTLDITYRAPGGKARRTERAAYLDAAWLAWRRRYPCECEGETGYVCGQHLREPPLYPPGHPDAGDINYDGTPELDPYMVAYRRKVIDRLARWLRWRDSRLRAMERPFQVGDLVAFVRGRRRGRPSEGTVTEVGRVVETHGDSVTFAGGSLSIVTAWVTGDGSDQRLDGTTRWLVPASWCVRVVMPGGDRPARKRVPRG